MICAALDLALDRTVVLGYTRVGYTLRSRCWQSTDPCSAADRRVLVSGATSGIGLAAAEGFARRGAHVTLLARDRERGARAARAIAARTANERVDVELCDLASLESVRVCARRLIESGESVDVLVNNAGVLSPVRAVSPDGIELTFATNVLGPFLLTALLLPALAPGTGARVVNVSSGGMYAQRLHAEDLQSEREDYNGATAYARSKRAEVVLSEMWAQRLASSGVFVAAMHPGWVDTPGLSAGLPRFHRLTRALLRSPAEGADTIVWLGLAPAPIAHSGAFWHDRRARPTHLLGWPRESVEQRERLWAQCERLSGLQDLAARDSRA